MLTSLRHAAKGLYSLLVGLRITGVEFAKPQLTVHYPRQVVGDAALRGYRGHIELVPLEDDPLTARCIACMQCHNICPSNCISLAAAKKAKPEKAAETVAAETQAVEAAGDTAMPKMKTAAPPKDGGKKQLTHFTLDFSLCSLCGLCVQTCPVASLRHSSNVYMASYDRKPLVMDLLARMRGQQASPALPGEGPRGGGKSAKLAPKKAFVKKDAAAEGAPVLTDGAAGNPGAGKEPVTEEGAA